MKKQLVIAINEVIHDEIVKHCASTVKHRPCGQELFFDVNVNVDIEVNMEI